MNQIDRAHAGLMRWRAAFLVLALPGFMVSGCGVSAPPPRLDAYVGTATQPDAETVMRSWMESPGHRDNLLAGDVRHVGIGYAYRADTRLRHYWVMVLADSEEPGVPPRRCG